jgi:hypothetical protein
MVAIDQDKAAAPGFVSRERLLCLENILSPARFLAHGLGEPVGGNRMGYYFITQLSQARTKNKYLK